MSSFWELTGFEYKKILRKKSTIIVLIITLLLTAFCCCAVLLGSVYVEGVPTETQMNAMRTGRAYSRALAGRAIDSELLLEMAEAYSKIPTEGMYRATEEYALYARPYSGIYGLARGANGFDVDSVGSMTEEQAASFYETRAEAVSENVNILVASDATKSRLLELDSQVETPFVFDFADGYARFFAIMYTTALLACFVVAVLLAPLFAGEYTSGADQLILSSKNGKKKLIYAKLFTGVTFAGGLCLLLTAITYLMCMLVYGFDGGNAALQLLLPMSNYPLTMGQAAGLYSLCIFMGTLLIAGITMLLSAKMKTPFGVIVPVGILIIAPMFISDPEKSALLSNLLCLLPTNMMGFWNVISTHLFEFGSLVLEPYIFMPIFALGAGALTLPFAYRGFKNHQIG